MYIRSENVIKWELANPYSIHIYIINIDYHIYISSPIQHLAPTNHTDVKGQYPKKPLVGPLGLLVYT